MKPLRFYEVLLDNQGNSYFLIPKLCIIIHSSRQTVIHVFNKQILSTYCFPGLTIRTGRQSWHCLFCRQVCKSGMNNKIGHEKSNNRNRHHSWGHRERDHQLQLCGLHTSSLMENLGVPSEDSSAYCFTLNSNNKHSHLLSIFFHVFGTWRTWYLYCQGLSLTC